MREKRGITLIALVVTIIILVILAGVTINLVFGNDGIIERSKEARFKTHFSEIQEKVSLYVADKDTDAIINGNTYTAQEKLPIKKEVSASEKQEFTDHLKAEIQQISGKEDITTLQLCYIDKEKIQSKQKHEYIIDTESFQIYDVEGDKFFKKWHHTLNGLGNTEQEETVPDDIIDDSGKKITHEGNIGWYSPNMKGFNGTYTYLVYYNKANTSDIKEVPVKEYIQNGKKNKIEENGKTYVLDLYNEKMWANVKTIANGLECWWVWVPRYSYKINSTDQQMEIIFVDEQDNPIGQVSDFDKINGTTTTDFASEYTIHPGFNVDGKKLQGIWVAKYEASNNTTHQMSTGLCYEPNLDGFDKEYTYIELYDEATSSFTEEKLLKNTDVSKVNQDNKWYDYSKKQWANIKTNANELECWWVWIPRYAYKISEGNQETEIIFIDLNNKPMDKQKYGSKLPKDFIVHPAFTTEGKNLKGIWVAKYEASNNTTHKMSTGLCYEPNLNGFDKNYTYIELYDETTSSFTEEKSLSEADLKTVNKDNKWYDYRSKKWANIKTTANGLECWWVWIPRYAYHISEGNQEVEIIFIDTNDTPMDKQRYGNTLAKGFTVHPGFNVDGKKLEGMWIAKYEASNVADVVGGTNPTGASTLPYASDTAGTKHTHVANGAGTKERFVTKSTKWCSGYDGTPCSNYGYYIYCSQCGVRLRHYWCKNHYNPSTKVIIDDENIS